MTTEGDKNQSQALYLLGGKALWTKELEIGLLDGSIDLIVHSLKDVPTVLPEGCDLGAILQREDPRDALVMKKGLEWKRLEDMPEGSVIGTSSVRRVALLRRAFPHLSFRDVVSPSYAFQLKLSSNKVSCREETCQSVFGVDPYFWYWTSTNRNTRISKLDAEDGPYSALILAAAGLSRLGFSDRITSFLGPPTLYPAVGQAALGVEIRSDDIRVKEIVQVLNHWQTLWTCLAERACLRVLEGGCSVPVGVSSHLTEAQGQDGTARLKIVGTVTSLDGATQVEATVDEAVTGAEESEALGRKLAEKLIANGAGAILDDIKKDRAAKQVKANIPVVPTETQPTHAGDQ
jgi:hydroxymethylbilane synthase